MARSMSRPVGILILCVYCVGFWGQAFAKDQTPANYSRFHDEEQEDCLLACAHEAFAVRGMPTWGHLGCLLLAEDEAVSISEARSGYTVKLRFFEGIKESHDQAQQSVTSSYLAAAISASIDSEADLDLEKAQGQLVAVFNLKGVRLLTEADLNWPHPEQGVAIHHLINVDGNTFLFALARQGEPEKRQFHISISQSQSSDTEKTTMLDTEIILPDRKTVILGLQNAYGKTFFLSLTITDLMKADTRAGSLGTQPERPAVEKGTPEDFERGAIRCSELVPPPELKSSVNAIYPEIAKQSKVEGIVNLDVRTDTDGRVKSVRVVRSVPLLDQAAVDAVRQWVFSPVIVDGNPVEVIFTIGIGFNLSKNSSSSVGTAWLFPGDEIVAGAVKIEGEMRPPKCIKYVPPVYPESARKSKVEGLVIMGVRTDRKGRVEAIRILRSVPLLDQAAIDAVRQWIYEPVVIKGKGRKAAFTVSLWIGPEPDVAEASVHRPSIGSGSESAARFLGTKSGIA